MPTPIEAATILFDDVAQAVETRYSDLFFDSTIAPDPLSVQLPNDSYVSIEFAWSGAERLALCNLSFGSHYSDKIGLPFEKISLTANTPLFSIDGSSVLPEDCEPRDENEYFATCSFEPIQANGISLERFCNFLPISDNLKITLVTEKGQRERIFNSASRKEEFVFEIDSSSIRVTNPKIFRLLLPALLDCLFLRLENTRKSFLRLRRRLGEKIYLQIGQTLNHKMLAKWHLEFGQHGVSHSFRYWTKTEKSKLFENCVTLCDAYKANGFSTMCCFGFVLGMVREKDLIPHDDDVDIVIFNFDSNKSDLQFMSQVAGVAALSGFEVLRISDKQSFVRLRTQDEKDVDVFVCKVSQEKCRIFPSKSEYSLYSTIFPLRVHKILGHALPFPNDPETLLEDIYGSDWRVPRPYFNHSW